MGSTGSCAGTLMKAESRGELGGLRDTPHEHPKSRVLRRRCLTLSCCIQATGSGLGSLLVYHNTSGCLPTRSAERHPEVKRLGRNSSPNVGGLRAPPPPREPRAVTHTVQGVQTTHCTQCPQDLRFCLGGRRPGAKALLSACPWPSLSPTITAAQRCEQSRQSTHTCTPDHH